MMKQRLIHFSYLLWGTFGSTPPNKSLRHFTKDLPRHHGTVSYDPMYQTASCLFISSECSSGSLFEGRGSNQEANYPNTIDGCADGNTGVYMVDESLERIVVSVVDSSSSSGGGAQPLHRALGDAVLEGGKQAQITATVYAYSGLGDFADFYYAEDASNPVWVYIDTIEPTVGGLQELSVTYTLPTTMTMQAVRVNYRHMGSVGSCTNGEYDDRDDLVFAVLQAVVDPNPSGPEACFEGTVELFMEGQCNADALYEAVVTKLDEYADSCSNADATFEILSMLNVYNVTDAMDAIDEMCKDAVLNALDSTPFEFNRFSGMDYDFNKAFFDGQSSWNDGGLTLKQAENPPSYYGGASPEWHGNSKAIVDIYNRHADRRQMTWPDEYQNFHQCELNAAMCCWVDHDEGQSAQYHNNTEICYVDNERAPTSNHVGAGFSVYGNLHGDEEAYCHGFAWEDGSLDDYFKGNHLFLSEIYENMHNRGLSNNVPGAPMCGCIEKMPVVSRADCSMLEFTGNFVFRHTSPSSNSITAAGAVRIGTTECDAVTDGISNDLRAYYDKLFTMGKVNEIQASYFDQIVVGDGFCGLAIYEFLGSIFNETVVNPVVTPAPKPPSASPSEQYSEEPSVAPSQSLTDSPSASPSSSPVKSTNPPSLSPSYNPTKSVTSSPSRSPSASPSYNPTNSPVETVTQSPSLSPSYNPTESVAPPSRSPSETPTYYPTNSPVKTTTLSPSLSPSYNPTKGETSSPSKSPSYYPTYYPTNSPVKTVVTQSPSLSPSYNPTNSPIKSVTSSPSKSPSYYPTYYPTNSPVKTVVTQSPSLSPSYNPTNAPVKTVTSSPSKSPSYYPTYYPTNSPVKTIVTQSPSLSPSYNPTSVANPPPTGNPTYYPTNAPITSVANPPPTANPSYYPTYNPTNSPVTSVVNTLPSFSPTQSPMITSSCVDGHHVVRKMKISSTTSEQLHMLEVLVYSNLQENVALGKTASQSSDYVTSSGDVLYASYAVDGDLATFSNTNDSSAWWMVDFEANAPVDKLLIRNRPCYGGVSDCRCKIRFASVQLLDEHGNVIVQDFLGNTCGIDYVRLTFPRC